MIEIFLTLLIIIMIIVVLRYKRKYNKELESIKKQAQLQNQRLINRMNKIIKFQSVMSVVIKKMKIELKKKNRSL